MMLRRISVLAVMLCAMAASAQITPGSFDFTTFSVPGTPSGTAVLALENLNNFDAIAGNLQPSPQSSGFLRFPNGTVVTLKDPLNTGAFQFTYASDVNDEGIVAGYYFDTTHDQYSGFFYRGGKFLTYNIPGLPAFSATTILGLNDLGDFCGYYQAAPAYVTVAYVNRYNHIDTNFPVPGSIFTEPISINNEGEVVGAWEDSRNHFHGFFRDWDGKITIIDVPGAAFQGTAAIGVNDFGWISGHFFDSGNHEHGFVRSPDGKFYQIDVPGADTTPGRGTSAGGINDYGVVAGHYDPPNNGIEQGYVARPDFDMDSH